MKGFPKHLNTKQDYLYVRENFSENQWRPVWLQLLDERFEWLNTKILKNDETGIVDKTHRTAKTEDVTGKTAEKYQQEYKEDPNAKLFRIGFTVDEITNLLK